MVLTLKVNIKENPKDKSSLTIKLEIPKDLSKASETEQIVAKEVLQTIDERFSKKGN